MTAVQGDARSGSPSGYILKKAWERLWKKGSPYYLPRVIAKGIVKKGHTVKPLSPLTVKDLGPIDLVNLEKLTLSVGMKDNTLTGLDNIENGGISYDDTNQTFSAIIASDGNFVFSGKYQLYTSSKVVACAIDAAQSILSMETADASEGPPRAQAKDDHSDLDVARDYRSKLVENENGRTLVGTYYDNNEAMSLMFESSEKPAKSWQQFWKQNPSTKQLMTRTSKACRNPHDSDHTVGGTPFNTESLTMAAGLLRQTNKMLDSGKYKDDPRFQKLASDISNFKGVATKHDDEKTAGSVMDTVKKDPKNVRDQLEAGTLDTTFDDEHIERAENILSSIEVKEDDDDDQAGYKTKARGSFEDTLSFKSLRVQGTLDPSGTDPNVSLKKVELIDPSIEIKLSQPSSGDESLYHKASEAIANSDFVRDLLIRRIKNKINSKETRSYLADRINDSIRKIFEGA